VSFVLIQFPLDREKIDTSRRGYLILPLLSVSFEISFSQTAMNTWVS
jgi:hypothetical protein